MDAILTAGLIFISILSSLIIFKLYQKSTNGICRSTKRLEGKTALVTGGTAGMGLEIATELARRGARVIVGCPYQKEGADALEHIIEKSKNDNIVFKLLDLGSLESVRELARDILKTEHRLDLLINNAGVGSNGNCQTNDGMHMTMQINYYGHFLLTLLLLPLLRKSGHRSDPSRIINTTSVLHNFGVIDLENFDKVGYYYGNYWSMYRIYCNSKLCMVLFSRELKNRLVGSAVVVNSIDPGVVGTNIFKVVICGSWYTFLFYYLSKTPWEGAQTALHVALDDAAGAVSGEYFKECKLSRANSSAYNEDNVKKLWDHSVKVVNMTGDELDESFRTVTVNDKI